MILDEIVAARRLQLSREKAECPLDAVEQLAKAAPPAKDFKAALQRERLSVIAEVKKASPSKGLIQLDFHPAETAAAYEAAGAAAVSVLTEERYFQGGSNYLKEVRRACSLPILRKDFLFDPYQIYEARAMGADAVLLIAALLPLETLTAFLGLTHGLGLACLVETHDEQELEKALSAGAEIIGINNRDLRTFAVDLRTTERLASLVPSGKLVVSESGIAGNADARRLRACGADAILVGETLMRSGDVAGTFAALTESV